MASELELINPKTIGTELQKYKQQMEAALPRHMTADRMARIALTSLRMNPKLMNTTRESFYGSLMAASQLGLEPGINGQCYLIPYGTTCTLVPGWRGYMDLLNRAGRAAARTEVVYKGDDFDYEMGTDVKIHHKRGNSLGNEEDITHVYAVGHIIGMSEFPNIDVWSIEKVKAHRDKQNKVGNRHYSYSHLEMYARKVVLLQILKYLPSSIELANASALDLTGTEGRQALTIDMALKGEFENGAGVDIPSADDPLQREIDSLFEKVATNPANQKLLRESYSTRPQELIDYLKGKLAPEIQTKAAEKTVVVQASAQETTVPAQEAQVGEVKRQRGRPSKEEMARRKAAEEGQQLLVPATSEPQPTVEPQEEEDDHADEEFYIEDEKASAFDLV
jgi:recombination protein RecT